MWATILSLAAGVFSKLIAGYFSSKRHEDSIYRLSTVHARHETIQLLQKTYDRPDWLARVCRCIITVAFSLTFLYLCWHIVINNPNLQYTIQTDRYMSPFWAFLNPFPVNQQGVLTINGVFVMERLWIAVWYIIGFHLNKFGK